MRRCFAVCLLVSSLAANAAPPRPEAIPPALQSWVPWVLHGDVEYGCPVITASNTAACVWPGTVALTLDDRGGRFTFGVVAYREVSVRVPGSSKQWPQHVTVDGRPALVVPGAEQAPTVRITAGAHAFAGDFAWDALPEAVDVPPDTGLLQLTVKGKRISLPNRDAEGRVFLQKETVTDDGERLDVAVFRLVTDDVPLLLTTRVQLKVSGKNREVVLSRALPEGFVATAVSSALPTRIEADGKLRLQVRAGQWDVTVQAYKDTVVSELKRPSRDGPWVDGDELWAFDARPSLRQVEVEGVTAVEPSSTPLPREWRRFPTYAMGVDDVMKLSERRRGDSDPAADVLNLKRTLWLDFDGAGYSVSDSVTGQLHRSWRLDVQPGTDLGRVVAGGADQSITKLTPTGPAGVELRQGALLLEAESRINGAERTIPAVSWDADFASVSGVMHVPPGWTVVAVGGADSVPGTWVSRWSLFDFFLVLITALATWRLFGTGWGVVALVTLALSWHEHDAPRASWLAVLAGEAIVRVLPEHWVKRVVQLYRWGAWAALVIITATFMVSHVRHGLYPGLAQTRALGGVKSYSEYSSGNEAQYARNSGWAVPSSGFGSMPDEPELERNFEGEDKDGSGDDAEDLSATLSDAPKPAEALRKADKAEGKRARADVQQQQRLATQEYDKNATVQTGPGLPRWEWRELPISFSGPVQRSQTLSLTLLSPGANRVLTFVRVVLLALLLLCLLGFPGSFWPAGWRRTSSVTSAVLALLLGAVLLHGAPAWAQAVPSPEVLEQLRVRLKEPPACAPACASIPRLQLDGTPTQLRVRLEVLAAARTTVPLPGHAQHWVPETVTLDGAKTAALLRAADGTAWLAVDEGAHQVVLEGPLPPRDTVQLGLPLKPARVETALTGWTVDGVHENGLADDSLQLSRKASSDSTVKAALQAGTLPPFVRLERTVVLGLTWSVETRLTRLSPTGSAVVLEVPLLPGESVTSSELRVVNGKALVNMPARDTTAGWSSVLEPKSPLKLSAPTGVPWAEVWRLQIGPMWHARVDGIPMVHVAQVQPLRAPEWRPWPGESVTIDVMRPDGVTGQTFTIDESSLVVSPGVRSTDVTLTANLRASRGGVHPLTLPANATLRSVTINGLTQPIRQSERTVSIPLLPGSQSVVVDWQQPDGLTASWHTPDVGLGTSTVNAELQVRLPAERWVLWVFGPPMGPAVLFWSFLVVVLLLAVGLGRIHWVPLTTPHWVLLALGLSQVPMVAIAFVFAWLLALGWRQREPTLSTGWFNLRQLALVAMTAIALGILATSIYEGLLGAPEMQIEGNGSSSTVLRWFQDRTDTAFPRGFVLSVPMTVYRLAMLAWSLWMSLALLRWLRFGWQAFSTEGLWARTPKVIAPPKTN